MKNAILDERQRLMSRTYEEKQKENTNNMFQYDCGIIREQSRTMDPMFEIE